MFKSRNDTCTYVCLAPTSPPRVISPPPPTDRLQRGGSKRVRGCPRGGAHRQGGRQEAAVGAAGGQAGREAGQVRRRPGVHVRYAFCRRALWCTVMSAFWWIRGIYFAGDQAPAHGACVCPQIHTTASFAYCAVFLCSSPFWQRPLEPLTTRSPTSCRGVEAQRVEAKERKRKWETEELRGFALARANQTGAFYVAGFG